MLYEKIRRLCFENHTNIYTLERECGISNATIGKWKGREVNPKYDTIKRIADFFHMSVDELMEGSEA